MIEREAALSLLKKYNKDSFHLRHALTVEYMMRWYAAEEGYKDEQDFWGLVGLLHDGTAVPMTAVMAACGIGALVMAQLAQRTAARKKQAALAI